MVEIYKGPGMDDGKIAIPKQEEPTFKERLELERGLLEKRLAQLDKVLTIINNNSEVENFTNLISPIIYPKQQ